jgi:hypothetical protein
MHQKQDIKDFLFRFFLAFICFFLFSVINNTISIQDKKPVNLAYVQKSLNTNQEFISAIPFELPKYSDEQLVIADLKILGTEFHFTQYQYSLQMNRELKKCQKTYLHHRPLNYYVIYKKLDLTAPDKDMPSLS